MFEDVKSALGYSSSVFNPDTEIPSLEGKVILVTGGNGGLGKQAVLQLAKHNPAQIWIAARNPDKAATAAKSIEEEVPAAKDKIKALQLDLSSLESVQKAAETFLSQAERLDILMLNAGVMAVPPSLSVDGYEIQFATNHLGHALLTKPLLPLLTKTATTGGPNGAATDVRVVVVSSNGHTGAPKGGIDFDTLKKPSEDRASFERYGQSKLANILFARQLAKEHPELTTVSLHPGVGFTDLGVRATDAPWIFKILAHECISARVVPSLDVVARHQLWASVAKEGLTSGEYYEPLGRANIGRPEGRDDALAKKLWDWTNEELSTWA